MGGGFGGLSTDLGHEFELRVVGWGGVVVGYKNQISIRFLV